MSETREQEGGQRGASQDGAQGWDGRGGVGATGAHTLKGGMTPPPPPPPDPLGAF